MIKVGIECVNISNIFGFERQFECLFLSMMTAQKKEKEKKVNIMEKTKW